MKIEKVVRNSIGIIFLVTMIYLAFKGEWQREWVLLAGLVGTYVPCILSKLCKIKFPKIAEFFFIFFLVGSQYLGSYLGFYGIFSWWDVMLHFVSGILIAYWGLILWQYVDVSYKPLEDLFISIWISILAGVSSAGLWEITEYLGDRYLGTYAQLGSLNDTMLDIICGTIGAGLFALYIGVCIKTGNAKWLQPLFEYDEKPKQEKLEK